MEEFVGHPNDAYKLAFVLGGVSGDERVRIHDHLQGCNACRQHVGEMAEVRRKEVLEEKIKGGMKILRLTRHAIVPDQLIELQYIFGDDAKIVEVSETVPNAARVVELVREHAADVVEAVLPLPLMADLLKIIGDVPVIRAITRREFDATGTKASFVFDHYERIVRVEVVTERL